MKPAMGIEATSEAWYAIEYPASLPWVIPTRVWISPLQHASRLADVRDRYDPVKSSTRTPTRDSFGFYVLSSTWQSLEAL